jgi:hypothetical protein
MIEDVLIKIQDTFCDGRRLCFYSIEQKTSTWLKGREMGNNLRDVLRIDFMSMMSELFNG